MTRLIADDEATMARSWPRGSSRRSAGATVLAPFTARAPAGGMLQGAEIQRALQEGVGKPVARSPILRLLDWHGWRQVVPRPRHP